MTSHLRHRDKPCRWIQPRQSLSASERYYRHGPIQPMDYDEPGFIARWFFRRQA